MLLGIEFAPVILLLVVTISMVVWVWSVVKVLGSFVLFSFAQDYCRRLAAVLKALRSLLVDVTNLF
jgi:hypothetical protein